MHIPFAQFGLFGSADTARVRLEHDADNGLATHRNGFLGGYHHTAVSIKFAQTTIAPRTVGVEVVADFEFVSCETLLYLFGGNVLLAICNPRATGHRLHINAVGFHGNGIGIPLATEIPKIAGCICIRSVGKGVAAYAYSDERFAGHILWRHQRLVFLRCSIVIGLYLAVRLVTR